MILLSKLDSPSSALDIASKHYVPRKTHELNIMAYIENSAVT